MLLSIVIPELAPTVLLGVLERLQAENTALVALSPKVEKHEVNATYSAARDADRGEPIANSTTPISRLLALP
jgi:hypothetical protein